MRFKRFVLYDINVKKERYKNLMFVSVNNNDYIFVEFDLKLKKSKQIVRINRRTKHSVTLSEKQFKLLNFKK